jgi:hypothetical protein
MKVKEIVDIASFYLGLDEDDAEARAALLRCANLVLNEIVCDYFPLRGETAAASVNGVVRFDALAERVLEIVSVESNGVRVKFKCFPGYLKAECSGTVKVNFSYVPEDRGENDDADVPEKIAPRLTAYGAAAEYCLLRGMFEEAVIWEKRFRDSLAAALKKQREIRIPARAWL